MSCTDCERCSFDDACAARDKVAPIPTKLDDWMHANGWEWPRSPFTGYVRLCAKCKAEPPEVEVTKVDHEARTVELRKVGSTDVCGKCGLSDCDHLKDFFIELKEKSGTEIRVPLGFKFPETCKPETGQVTACVKCHQVGCTRNHPEFT